MANRAVGPSLLGLTPGCFYIKPAYSICTYSEKMLQITFTGARLWAIFVMRKHSLDVGRHRWEMSIELQTHQPPFRPFMAFCYWLAIKYFGKTEVIKTEISHCPDQNGTPPKRSNALPVVIWQTISEPNCGLKLWVAVFSHASCPITFMPKGRETQQGSSRAQYCTAATKSRD